MLARSRLIRRIVKVLNRIPLCRAQSFRFLPDLIASDAPDIFCVIRGRAVLFKVFTPQDPIWISLRSRDLDSLSLWSEAGARAVSISSPESAARIVAEVSAAQDRLLAHQPPSEALINWRQIG